jgi:hypothetical protein
MKKTILFATIVLSIASFIGCKKDETTTSTPSTCTFNNTSLVGTWKFSNVRDSLGNDILSKVDNCMDGNIFTFTKDSFQTSKCDNSNVNSYYTATVVDNIKYLTIGGNKITVSNFDCKTMTFTQNINRSGMFVGTAYYSMLKQ